MLNLAFLLDITGSMSCELDGVKATVARLVESVSADYADELIVTIITFTEDHKGCYVTRDSFADGHEAAQFVGKITLCVPPGMSSVNASGGDGPENHKAALAELMRLDPEVPTVAFLISDAIPHMLDTPSTESTLERNYLSHEHGITDSDLFGLLERLALHFGDNLVLSVLKYYQTTDHALYGAVAKRFNGVLITPVQRTPEQLANGLMAILLQMFQSIAGAAVSPASENPETAEALSAFKFYDLENVTVPENERGRTAIATPVVGSTDELLFKLIERTTVIAGGRFKKRAITAHLVSEQVELLLVLAKGLLREISKDEALERSTLLLGKIRSLMGEEHASQFKIRVDELDALLSNEEFVVKSDDRREFEAAVSAITLMSIEETARDITLDEDTEEDVPEPRDPYASLLAVASLFLGHLSVLKLPMRMGVVDFMDSWSAVVEKISNDVVSAADFLTMIGDKESVAGLAVRDREYNFLQLVADPKDAVGSELLRVASGTQVLDILTALLSGAPAGLFSPNMFRGTISASLMTLLSTYDAELTEYQWVIVRKMVHTVRLLIGATPTTLEVEPESAMGKLLFRLLRMTKGVRPEDVDERALRDFLEEMAAARAQKFAKYNNGAYLQLVEELIGYEHDEAAVSLDVFAPHVLLDGEDIYVNAARAVAVVEKSSFCHAFERCARNVLRAVLGDDAPSLAQIWPTFTNDLPKLLLLQKRTERYTLSAAVDSAADKSWTRNDEVMGASLESSTELRARALALLRQKYEVFVRATRKLRQDEAAQERWRHTVKLMRAPLDQFVSQLSTFVYSNSRREHKLLLKALTLYGHELSQDEYEAKVTAVVTGRVVEGDSDRVVFNRGNLLAEPHRFVPMTAEFKAKLRGLQRSRKWSTRHVYREGGPANHSGHSNANPSAWAAKRSDNATTFWDESD